MMLTVPLLVAVAVATALVPLANRVAPVRAARYLSIAIGSVLGAAWLTTWALSLAFLAHHPLVGGQFVWCRQLAGLHHPPPPFVGEASLLVATMSTGRLLLVLHRWHRSRGSGAGGVHLVESSRPFAFAEPGRSGGIIVSSAMLGALAAKERHALLAHEQAHLRHRHDLYLLVATFARGIPVLSTLASRLRHALERWADEEAAETTGDRLVVARAVARAALATVDPTPVGVLAGSGSSVPARVTALASPPNSTSRWTYPAAGVVVVVVTAALTQVHHLLPIVASLSRH